MITALLVILGLISLYLVLWDLRIRRLMTIKHSTDPTRPSILPYDPFFFVVRHFARMVSGDISKRPDCVRVHQEVVLGSHQSAPLRCRAVYFFGFRSYTFWDLSFIKPIMAASSLGKVANLSEPITKIFGESVLFANGDDWTRQRHLMNHVFRIPSIKNFLPIFVNCAQKLVSNLRRQEAKSAESEPFEVFSTMADVTMDILGKAAFTFDFKATDGEMHKVKSSYNAILDAIGQPLRFFNAYNRLPLATNLRLEKHYTEFSTFINDLVRDKSKALEDNAEAKDLLDDLILAGKEDETSATGLSAHELHDNAAVFFLAGHETTSAALTYTLSLLATHPSIQSQVQKEADKFLEDGEITYEKLSKLMMIPAVIKESLRLFPPAPVVSRTVEEDFEINGYKFLRGSVFNVLIYSMHRSTEYWPRAEEFLPERFIKGTELNGGSNLNAWMPFAGGSRICIGMDFALTEMKVMLLHLCHHFNFSQEGLANVQPGRGITMRPRAGYKLKGHTRG